MAMFDHLKRPPRPSQLGKETVRGIDRYDQQDMERIAKEIKDFRTSREALEEVIDTGTTLFHDSFYSFLKASPKIKGRPEVPPTHWLNQAVTNEMVTMPEWERLRTWTQGDPISSGLAAVSFEPELESLADKAKKHQEKAEQLQKQMEEMAAAQEGQRSLEDMIEDWKDQPEFDPEQMAELLEMIQAAIDQQAQDLADTAEALGDSADQAVALHTETMRAALGKAADEQEAQQAQMQMWGTERGEIQRMDPQRRLKLAEMLNTDKFKRMAEIWGPMDRIASAEQMRKVYHSNEEVYDVSVGNDLSRVLPMEFATLRHKTLKLDFYRKFTEGKLLQYEMQGVEKVGKGGIIFAMDNSGSMAGDPECWAKAIGLCSMNIAREQKRAFYGIHFASRGQIKTFPFPDPTDIELEDIIDYAGHYFGGGTDFVTPLNECIRLLEAEFAEKGHVEADVVFLTDGICGVPADWLEQFLANKERLGFQVHGIMVGPGSDSEPFRSICDTRVTVTDMLTGNDVRGVFRDL